MKDLESKARKMIEDNMYMTIATAAKNGKPWISPVFFAYDSKLNFYWSSAKNSLHSRLINKNKRVSAAIFNSNAAEGKGDGVYMVGKATEVKEKEIKHAMDILFYRTGKINKYFKDKTEKDFKGNSPIRFYKFVPKKFWVLGDPVEIDGKFVDIRREVRMKKFI